MSLDQVGQSSSVEQPSMVQMGGNEPLTVSHENREYEHLNSSQESKACEFMKQIPWKKVGVAVAVVFGMGVLAYYGAAPLSQMLSEMENL